jgi:uncharacterized protein (DUF4415 family)
MTKRGGTVRYSADEIKAMIARGDDRTDWAKVDATTEAEIERHAVEDDSVLPEGWESGAMIGLPPRKEHINIRIDAEVLQWFKATGKGYQTRMNNVLRAFVESRRRAGS